VNVNVNAPSKARQEQLLAELAKLREKVPPEQYARASARLVYEINKPKRSRYTLT
jgi:hypothetical protein